MTLINDIGDAKIIEDLWTSKSITDQNLSDIVNLDMKIETEKDGCEIYWAEHKKKQFSVGIERPLLAAAAAEGKRESTIFKKRGRVLSVDHQRSVFLGGEVRIQAQSGELG